MIAGKIVDLAGCQLNVGEAADDEASSDSDYSVSKWLYAFSAVLVCAAVFVTFYTSPNSKKTPTHLEENKNLSKSDSLAISLETTEQE